MAYRPYRPRRREAFWPPAPIIRIVKKWHEYTPGEEGNRKADFLLGPEWRFVAPICQGLIDASVALYDLLGWDAALWMFRLANWLQNHTRIIEVRY